MKRTAPPARSRLLLTGGVLAVTALALAGCGRGTDTGAAASADLTVDDSAATGTVTLWAPDGDAQQLDTVLADYEAENPDLDLEVTLVPSDEYNTKLQTAVAAGTAPDIAFLYTEAQTQFLASDAFAPVPDDLVDSDSFFEGSWDAGEYDGTTYSVPWYAYTRVLIYRSDFAEAGESPPRPPGTRRSRSSRASRQAAPSRATAPTSAGTPTTARRSRPSRTRPVPTSSATTARRGSSTAPRWSRRPSSTPPSSPPGSPRPTPHSSSTRSRTSSRGRPAR
ncbi:extracellular solute-binding protein [Rathayibacter oskolensis]|uniref:ABC transporter substrate-binding protein n=1 Tax=Rathayibacter oskolensis TaxID=1891671 RepID=UPI0026604B07|nr:extracellular solute-binding protein [Rathayibacter oskolensis]WKK72908.1 extracellular solute-binding protein [Rathayibacter oskolensis]